MRAWLVSALLAAPAFAQLEEPGSGVRFDAIRLPLGHGSEKDAPSTPSFEKPLQLRRSSALEWSRLLIRGTTHYRSRTKSLVVAGPFYPEGDADPCLDLNGAESREAEQSIEWRKANDDDFKFFRENGLNDVVQRTIREADAGKWSAPHLAKEKRGAPRDARFCVGTPAKK